MKIVPQQSRVLVELIDDNFWGKIALPQNMETPEYSRCIVREIGAGRTLENGTVIPIPLKIGAEVVCDMRFAMKLMPEQMYENKKLAIVDYAGVQCEVIRNPGEPVFTMPKSQPEPVIVQRSQRLVIAQ